MRQFGNIKHEDTTRTGEPLDETLLATFDVAACRGVPAELLLESVSATRTKCCPVAYTDTEREWFIRHVSEDRTRATTRRLQEQA